MSDDYFTTVTPFEEAMENLSLKFSSGNDILVERATITRKEYESITEEMERLLNMVYKHYGKPENWDKWGFSIAVVNYKCPKCGAPKEYCCATPSGKQTWPPHNERCMLLTPEEIEQTRGSSNIQEAIDKFNIEPTEEYRKEYLE